MGGAIRPTRGITAAEWMKYFLHGSDLLREDTRPAIGHPRAGHKPHAMIICRIEEGKLTEMTTLNSKRETYTVSSDIDRFEDHIASSDRGSNEMSLAVFGHCYMTRVMLRCVWTLVEP